MSWRSAALLVATALALAACGGSGGDHAASTTTSSTSSTSTSSTVPVKYATPHTVAYIATQVDDQLRRAVVAADPCIHGPHGACVGEALQSFNRIDDLAGAVSLLTQTVTKGGSLYAGELPPELTGLYTATIDAGAAAKASAEEAQKACLPTATATCDDRRGELDDALIALYKLFNQWRHRL